MNAGEIPEEWLSNSSAIGFGVNAEEDLTEEDLMDKADPGEAEAVSSCSLEADERNEGRRNSGLMLPSLELLRASLLGLGRLSKLNREKSETNESEVSGGETRPRSEGEENLKEGTSQDADENPPKPVESAGATEVNGIEVLTEKAGAESLQVEEDSVELEIDLLSSLIRLSNPLGF